jgi:hypothetical protein
LVEPYLSLITSSDTTYSKLILVLQQLDQREADPASLLQSEKPAFTFVSQEIFQSKRYDDNVCQAIIEIANALRPKIIQLLQAGLRLSKAKG